MNIFLTSNCPQECARALDDKRVVKMTLETAQLLASACHTVGVDIGYKNTHANHPCGVWTRASRLNFLWLIFHGRSLCSEYKNRYDRNHASSDIVGRAWNHRNLFPDKPLSFDFNCSGFDTGDVFRDYQLCLANKWRHRDVRKPTWRVDGPPPWKKAMWGLDFNNLDFNE